MNKRRMRMPKAKRKKGVNLNDDNPFSFIEEIKLVPDKKVNALLDKAMQKAKTKGIEEN